MLQGSMTFKNELFLQQQPRPWQMLGLALSSSASVGGLIWWIEHKIVGFVMVV
jgi:hypothetical protein